MERYQRVGIVALAVACLFLAWDLFAQMHDQDAVQPATPLHGMCTQDLQLLRHDIQKQKQKLIAENLPMTESEAIKFWAVYQKYSADLKAINDEKFAMLHGYSTNWQTMSNDDAMIFMRRWLEVDEKVVQLRSKYLPAVRDALPGKKAATFFQLAPTARPSPHSKPMHDAVALFLASNSFFSAGGQGDEWAAGDKITKQLDGRPTSAFSACGFSRLHLGGNLRLGQP